jgi:hypothetical protein
VHGIHGYSSASNGLAARIARSLPMFVPRADFIPTTRGNTKI